MGGFGKLHLLLNLHRFEVAFEDSSYLEQLWDLPKVWTSWSTQIGYEVQWAFQIYFVLVKCGAKREGKRCD